MSSKLLEKEVIFREDLEEIFGKRAWDPELTETPLNATVEQTKETETLVEEVPTVEKEESAEAPKAGTEL